MLVTNITHGSRIEILSYLDTNKFQVRSSISEMKYYPHLIDFYLKRNVYK